MTIRDARQISDGDTVEADVCIVGAGPAGLTAAMELLDQGIRVCLVESGGFERDAATQSLAHTEVVQNDDLYLDGYYLRDRRFGGTANQWCIVIDGQIHVRYTPLDPIDFERRENVPYSGWPISRADLDPYYARAQSAAEAGIYDYEAASWVEDGYQPMWFKSGRVQSKIFTFGRRDLFLQDHRARLERSAGSTLLTFANVVELETDPAAGTVTAARIACLTGSTFRVGAKQFVLAQGALEVPRLLLASRAAQKNGLGNGHDLVGRFLQDHQLVGCGGLVPRDPGLYAKAGFYDIRQRRGTLLMSMLTLSPETLVRERLLNAATGLYPRKRLTWQAMLQRIYGRGTTSRSPGYRAARQLLEDWRSRRFPSDLAGKLGRLVAGFDDVLYIKTRSDPVFKPAFDIDHGGWHQNTTGLDHFDVVQLIEQAPDPENRITLVEDRDATGMAKSRIAWKWNDIDVDSICRTQEILKHEFAQAGVGELTIERRGRYPLQIQSSTHHPAGTARMSAEPSRGVVDADCRVHGVRNLFIASSAVFPTSGYANPTLTILALAIRVADRVKASLGPVTVTSELTGVK